MNRRSAFQIVYEEAPPHIREMMAKLNPREFEGLSPTDVRQYIRSTMPEALRITLDPSENSFKYTQNRDRGAMALTQTPDTTECLVKEIGRVRKALQPLVSYDSISLPHRRILLDTRNRNLAYDDYSWSIVERTTFQQGDVNARDSIQQIVEIFCEPFSIPYQPLFYDSIRMGIQEFEPQATEISTCEQFSARVYYHFEFDITNVSNKYWKLTPKSSFRPSSVISQCNSITLNFYGNTEKLTFAPDRMTATVAAGFPATLTTAVAHGLTTGDLVYVTLGALYNKTGYVVAVVSPTEFTVQATGVVESTVFIIAARRIQIPMNFICIEK